jgi:hypothetical protein
MDDDNVHLIIRNHYLPVLRNEKVVNKRLGLVGTIVWHNVMSSISQQIHRMLFREDKEF